MPFGSDCRERAPMRVAGWPSCGIFQTPRLPASQDARFAYRLSCSSNVRPVRPAKNEPQNVSGGAPSGSSAYVDWLPSAAILRISPVSARLTYLLLSWSIARLSGVSSNDGLNWATVSTWANAQGAAASSKAATVGMSLRTMIFLSPSSVAELVASAFRRKSSAGDSLPAEAGSHAASAFTHNGRKTPAEPITGRRGRERGGRRLPDEVRDEARDTHRTLTVRARATLWGRGLQTRPLRANSLDGIQLLLGELLLPGLRQLLHPAVVDQRDREDSLAAHPGVGGHGVIGLRVRTLADGEQDAAHD